MFHTVSTRSVSLITLFLLFVFLLHLISLALTRYTFRFASCALLSNDKDLNEISFFFYLFIFLPFSGSFHQSRRLTHQYITRPGSRLVEDGIDFLFSV